jgi:soluble lytic murein transglycosylase-like protein
MKTYMLLAALIFAPMTSSAFDSNGWPESADESVRGSILQEMAGYSDSSLTPIQTAVKDAKTQKQLTQARTDFENWKTVAMQKRSAEAKLRINSHLTSQTALVNALRAPARATNGEWGSYFDGAKKASASGPAVKADAAVGDVRYNYGKVRAIAMSQGAKKSIVDAAIEEATLQDVDPKLVLAIIQRESEYDPRAVGTSGEIGLMQLMPGTARDMGVYDSNNLFDERTNIRAGIKYLRWMANFLGLDIDFSNIRRVAEHKKRALLAANNAGVGNVLKWRKKFGENFQILFATTRSYVSDILGALSSVW